MQRTKSPLFSGILHTASKSEVRELFFGDGVALSSNIPRWRLKKYFLNSKIATITKPNPTLLIHQWSRSKQGVKVSFLLTGLPGVYNGLNKDHMK